MAPTADNTATATPGDQDNNEDYLDGIEETWTFVGDELFQSTVQDKAGGEFNLHGDGAAAGTLPPLNDDEEDVAC